MTVNIGSDYHSFRNSLIDRIADGEIVLDSSGNNQGLCYFCRKIDNEMRYLISIENKDSTRESLIVHAECYSSILANIALDFNTRWRNIIFDDTNLVFKSLSKRKGKSVLSSHNKV